MLLCLQVGGTPHAYAEAHSTGIEIRFAYNQQASVQAFCIWQIYMCAGGVAVRPTEICSRQTSSCVAPLPSRPHATKYERRRYPKSGMLSEMKPYRGLIIQGKEARPVSTAACTRTDHKQLQLMSLMISNWCMEALASCLMCRACVVSSAYSGKLRRVNAGMLGCWRRVAKAHM